jgi:hypothetical protein
MKREILDYAACILSREPTRTLSTRALHERTTAELRIDFGYAHLLAALGSRPDRFTIVAERAPFHDNAFPDSAHLAAQLEHSGALRGATVTLADTPPADESGPPPTDDVTAALAATLADAHAGVLSLLEVEKHDPVATSGAEAVIGLDELRAYCRGDGGWTAGTAIQFQIQIPNFEIERMDSGNCKFDFNLKD